MIRATGIVRLVRDPELRDAGGTQVCNMRVAYDTRRKVDGEWTAVGNFIDVAAFGRQAETCAEYLSKGSQAFVDGRLEIREYEKDGEKRSAAQIIADNVQFIGGKNSGSDGGASDDPAATDDDIPF